MLFLLASWPCCRVTDIVAASIVAVVVAVVAGHCGLNFKIKFVKQFMCSILDGGKKQIGNLCGRLLAKAWSFGHAGHQYTDITCFALFLDGFRFPNEKWPRDGYKTVLFSCTYHSIMAIPLPLFLSLSL